MKNKYDFTEAEPLLRFIDENRDKIIGQHIRGFYSVGLFAGYSDFYNMTENEPDDWVFYTLLSGGETDCPIAFRLDDFCIVVEYYFISELGLYITDTDSLISDLSLNFLFKDIPESSALSYNLKKTEFPYTDKEISDIQIERFSEEFEIDPSTGETCPDGGDYFSTITVTFTDNERMHIHGGDADDDGYMFMGTSKNPEWF